MHVSPTTKAMIDRVADVSSLSKATVVRLAVERYMAVNEIQMPKEEPKQ